MIYTQYGLVVEIIAKDYTEGNPPDKPGMVKIRYADGKSTWRSPYELKADNGEAEIWAAVANVPEDFYRHD